MMAKCSAVYFCKGWSKSKGCMVEYLVATIYNLDILYEDDEERVGSNYGEKDD